MNDHESNDNHNDNDDDNDDDDQIAQIALKNESPIHSRHIHGGFLDLDFRY